MITFGTIKEINRIKNRHYVLLLTPRGTELICSAKNVDGVSIGTYVAVGGYDTGKLLRNALLMPYSPTKNYLAESQYKPLWLR